MLGTEVAQGAQTEIAAMLIYGNFFPNSSPLEHRANDLLPWYVALRMYYLPNLFKRSNVLYGKVY